MRTRLLVLAAAMMCSAAGVSSAQTVVGSGFTYQGTFADNGAPALTVRGAFRSETDRNVSQS